MATKSASNGPIYLKERVLDQAATAAAARELHGKYPKLSFAKIAAEMGISPAQVHYLEGGKRTWSADVFNKFVAAVKALEMHMAMEGLEDRSICGEKGVSRKASYDWKSVNCQKCLNLKHNYVV